MRACSPASLAARQGLPRRKQHPRPTSAASRFAPTNSVFSRPSIVYKSQSRRSSLRLRSLPRGTLRRAGLRGAANVRPRDLHASAACCCRGPATTLRHYTLVVRRDQLRRPTHGVAESERQYWAERGVQARPAEWRPSAQPVVGRRVHGFGRGERDRRAEIRRDRHNDRESEERVGWRFQLAQSTLHRLTLRTPAEQRKKRVRPLQSQSESRFSLLASELALDFGRSSHHSLRILIHWRPALPPFPIIDHGDARRRCCVASGSRRGHERPPAPRRRA